MWQISCTISGIHPHDETFSWHLHEKLAAVGWSPVSAEVSGDMPYLSLYLYVASRHPRGIPASQFTQRGNGSIQSDATRSQEMACCDKCCVSEGGENNRIFTKFAKSCTFVPAFTMKWLRHKAARNNMCNVTVVNCHPTVDCSSSQLYGSF